MGGRLIVPRGWTQLHRFTIHSLIVAKNLQSPMSFCSPCYFPAFDRFSFFVFSSTYQYFIFLLYFPFILSRTSPPKILLMPRPGCRSLLQRTSISHTSPSSLLPFPPALPSPILPTLPIFPKCFVPHFPSQNPVDQAAGPSSSVLPFPCALPTRTFLHSGFSNDIFCVLNLVLPTLS